VLVGHSLGGLVLKKLVVEAHRAAPFHDPGKGSTLSPLQSRCKVFCNNLAGAFFFATPHCGAQLGSLAKAVGLSGPVLDYLTVFNRDAAVLSGQFSMAFPTLDLMALVETKGYKVRAAGRLFLVDAADHWSFVSGCRPCVVPHRADLMLRTLSGSGFRLLSAVATLLSKLAMHGSTCSCTCTPPLNAC
jgi:hypothetical protein